MPTLYVSPGYEHMNNNNVIALLQIVRHIVITKS